MNSLNLSFGQESKSSHSTKSFLLLSNIFKKLKRINCRRYLIACALPEIKDHIYSFQVDVSPPCHLKTSGNLWFLIFLGV